MRARIPPRSRLEIAADRMRALFSSLGYFECVTDSLTDPRWPTAAVWTERQPLALDPRSVLREDHSVLRTSLLTSLLSVQRLNQDRRAGPARIFECGRVYLPRSGSAQPEERPAAGLLDEHGFAALADALRRLPEALEAPGARIELEQCAGSQAPAFLAPEAACRVLLVQREDAPRHAGWLGLAAGQLCKAFDLRRAPAVAELDMSLLAGCPPSPPAFRPLPTQPEVVRDVALVVDEAVAWGEIERFAAECGKREPLRDAQAPPRFLSAYRGKQIGAGKKSVAFSIVYRAPDRSLTDEEVNTAHGKFVEALLKEFNATLRA
jgi:phenylalanyl-tRNA synthetase beta chain